MDTPSMMFSNLIGAAKILAMSTKTWQQWPDVPLPSSCLARETSKPQGSASILQYTVNMSAAYFRLTTGPTSDSTPFSCSSVVSKAMLATTWTRHKAWRHTVVWGDTRGLTKYWPHCFLSLRVQLVLLRRTRGSGRRMTASSARMHSSYTDSSYKNPARSIERV